MNDKKYSHKGLFIRILIFFLWFGLLVFFIDGLNCFTVIADKIGYALTEVILWLLVFVPAIPILLYMWRYFRNKRIKD